MINGIQNDFPIRQVSAAKSIEPKAVDIDETSEPAQKNVDEYVPSEEKEPIGLYEIERDEQGNTALKFDAPKAETDELADKSEQTTANTDNVDCEIKTLKDERNALQRALRSAAPDEAEELRKQLEQVNAELALKDNDSYRKANTVFS